MHPRWLFRFSEPSTVAPENDDPSAGRVPDDKDQRRSQNDDHLGRPKVAGNSVSTKKCDVT